MTATAAQTTNAGARCVSVRAVPGKWAPVAPAVYEATRRNDGALTWRCVERAPCGTIPGPSGRARTMGFWAATAAASAARKLSDRLGIPCVGGIRHGSRCA